MTSWSLASFPEVRVMNVRRAFDNGEHNAFSDLIRYRGNYYLTFRSCPDGHMVHPSASIIVLRSANLQDWKQVHTFRVPLRDTRDPHFLEFKNKLFIFTGTWYCGESSPAPEDYDLNQHLGYGVYTSDGQSWSPPTMLEGTFGHYIWRADCFADTAYLCGRRKHAFDVRPRGEGPDVESAMLASDDGLIWKTHSLFQPQRGDETAFQLLPDGTGVGIARRGSASAELLRSRAPFRDWQRTDLGRYIGGPLLVRWGDHWVVGGRQRTAAGMRTRFCWLDGDSLVDMVELPSDGDNSYPGFVALSPSRAVVSWYSSHERDEDGKRRTAIYTAELVMQRRTSERKRIAFPSSLDDSQQFAYLSVPQDVRTNREPNDGAPLGQKRHPLVVSLHSWSADMEQRQLELEALVADRGWFCLQPNFRGANKTPHACGSPWAQQDILDAVDFVVNRYAVNPAEVYLTGTSGGGHMTMLMAAKYPARWRAASAWVGISDLVRWHDRHREGKYGAMLRQCCGGAPEHSTEVLSEYRNRSPLTFLAQATNVPLDIAAGIFDGHTGSVPIRHSLEAFNRIARAVHAESVTEAEMRQLSRSDGRLEQPRPGDQGFDSSFGRAFYLRRYAAKSRVTIFDGGHEGIAEAVMAWFDLHRPGT